MAGGLEVLEKRGCSTALNFPPTKRRTKRVRGLGVCFCRHGLGYVTSLASSKMTRARARDQGRSATPLVPRESRSSSMYNILPLPFRSVNCCREGGVWVQSLRGVNKSTFTLPKVVYLVRCAVYTKPQPKQAPLCNGGKGMQNDGIVLTLSEPSPNPIRGGDDREEIAQFLNVCV